MLDTYIGGGKELYMCQDMFLLSLRGTSIHLQKVMQWIGIAKRSTVLLGIADLRGKNQIRVLFYVLKNSR